MPESYTLSNGAFLSRDSFAAAMTYNIFIFSTPGSQEILADEVSTFSLPSGVFRHTNLNANIMLEAELADGRPLPEWIKFDPTSGRFVAKPPSDVKGNIDIKITARDDHGNVAIVDFQLHVTENRGKTTEKTDNQDTDEAD